MVPLIRRRLVQRLAMAGMGAVLALASSSLALAAPGYGPPPPPPVPGGYFSVVTSVTIGPVGGTIGPVGVDGVLVTLRVPRGAFPIPVQVTLTAPVVHDIGNAGFRHEQAFSGVGVLVQADGQTYSGQFLRPLDLTLASRRINASDLFVVWNGTRFVRLARSTVHGDRDFSVFDSEHEQDFAVLRHASGHRGTRFTAAGSRPAGVEVLAREFLVPAGSPPSGLGVLAPEWLQAVS